MDAAMLAEDAFDEEKELSGADRVRMRALKVQRTALAARAFAEVQISKVISYGI